MEQLLPGKLVYLDIINKGWTVDDFTVYTKGPTTDSAYLYEYIDVDTFPSFRDFSGKEILVHHNDPCTILSKIGRPYKIAMRSNLYIYDIYKVLASNSDVFYVFRYNLKLVRN